MVLNVLARQRHHSVHSVLVADKRVDGLGPVFEQLQNQVPVYAASQAVLLAREPDTGPRRCAW